MFGGILLLLACNLAGEFAVRLFGIEVPGAIVGMLLFLVLLRSRLDEHSPLMAGPELLLRHLQLLFVPAGVGLVVYLDRLRDDALPLAAGLWISWVIGFALTAYVVTGLLRLRGNR